MITVLPVELALLTADYLNTDNKQDHLSCLQSLQMLNSDAISRYKPNYFHTVRAMNNLTCRYVVTKVVINVHRSWQKMLQHPNSKDINEIFINAHFGGPINQYPPCVKILRLSDKFNTDLLDITAATTLKEIHCLPSHKKYLTTVPKCVKIICGQELYMFSFVLGQTYYNFQPTGNCNFQPTGNCNFQPTEIEPRLIITEAVEPRLIITEI